MQVKDRAEKVIQGGAPFVNLVAKDSSKEGLIIYSHGQIRGASIKLADEKNTTQVSIDASWGNLTILVPTDSTERKRQEYFLSSIDSKFSSNIAETIKETIKQLNHVKKHRIRVRILFASEDSGYYISEKSDLSNGNLNLSFVALVSPPSRGRGIRGPWVNAIRAVAHELLHVEHFLRGESDTVLSPSGEVAAELMAWCAHSAYLVEMGILDNKEQIHLGKEESVHVFLPGIYKGDFNPNGERIIRGQDNTFIGSFLARAIVFTQASQGLINIAHPSTRTFLEERCNNLPKSIPDYLNGEW